MGPNDNTTRLIESGSDTTRVTVRENDTSRMIVRDSASHRSKGSLVVDRLRRWVPMWMISPAVLLLLYYLFFGHAGLAADAGGRSAQHDPGRVLSQGGGRALPAPPSSAAAS